MKHYVIPLPAHEILNCSVGPKPFIISLDLIVSMALQYWGKRVFHRHSWRVGTVVTAVHWGRHAGKMWILFDDGEVELRWQHVFQVLLAVDDC
jgi:hypothetical protein